MVEYSLVIKYNKFVLTDLKKCIVKKNENDEYVMISVGILIKSPLTNTNIKH